MFHHSAALHRGAHDTRLPFDYNRCITISFSQTILFYGGLDVPMISEVFRFSKFFVLSHDLNRVLKVNLHTLFWAFPATDEISIFLLSECLTVGSDNHILAASIRVYFLNEKTIHAANARYLACNSYSISVINKNK